MKNTNDLMQLLVEAMKQNNEKKHWFFSYSGHVQGMDVRLYPNGWKSYDSVKNDGGEEPISITKSCYLDNPESVQELYYWVKFKINE